MKRAVFLIIGLVLLGSSAINKGGSSYAAAVPSGDSVTIVTTPGVSAVAATWAREYNKSVPGGNIRITELADPGKTGELIRSGSVGLLSGDELQGLASDKVWSLVLGKEILVPVINSSNPWAEEIIKKGLSPEKLAVLAKTGEKVTWGDLLGNGKNNPVSFSCPAEPEAMKSISVFLQADQAGLASFAKDDDRLLKTVQSDQYAIGFISLVKIVDPSSQALAENISLLPIDRNGNGILDFGEKIYDDVNGFTRGVWIGKYPKALVLNICSASLSQATDPGSLAFLKWIISDGQKYLPGSGYTELLACERTTATDRINTSQVFAGAAGGGSSLLKPALYFVITVILAGLLVTTVVKQRKRKKAIAGFSVRTAHGILDQGSMMIPGGIYFDKTHTWAFMEESGTVRVGIDDFLQHVTGKITRIKMKGAGQSVKKGEQILSVIQNGKQLNLYAPVSGRIVEQNMALEDNPGSLNSSPYRDGWVYRIEPSNWVRESQLLFMAEKQKEFIKKEFARLKDFLMNFLKEDQAYAQLILQDGGEISDGVLSEMGPETWEDFQTSFIDPSKQVWFYEIF